MKKTLLCSLFFMIGQLVMAQSTWTWLKGEPYTPGYGSYGIKGVAAPTNKPGRRTGQVTWQDAAGNTWMFGGQGNSASGSGYLNDVWKYERATGMWTWMSGEPGNDRPGIYGTKEVPSPNNIIPSRVFSAGSIDALGNLWVYGGQGYFAPHPTYLPVKYNDLWKYTPSTNMWTWVSGDSLYKQAAEYGPVFGTKGVTAAASKPGSKQNAVMWIDDASSNIWLFGGYGLTGLFPGYTNIGPNNDLWKYSTLTGQWTWMGGDTTIKTTGRYGTMGVASPLNKPDSKYSPAGWKDKSGNFWLFGGFNAPGGSATNDLWTFAPSTGQWTWSGGDTVTNQPSVYGTKGVPSLNNKPGARIAASQWTDAAGSFWFYGGAKQWSVSYQDWYNGGTGYNDIWKYTPGTKEWTWIGGDSTAGSKPAVYGQMKIPSDSTRPSSGYYTGAWADTAGSFWLASTDLLWNYSPVTNQWTWVSGDTAMITTGTFFSYPGVYGIKGVGSQANLPHARKSGATWKDAQGNLWLFGGEGSSSTNSGGQALCNDMWKYTPATNIWTWLKGDSTFNPVPNYGVQGIPSDTSTPGGRTQAATWTDASGNLWLFGGVNTYYTGDYNDNSMGDLWKYTPSGNQWTWMGGSSNIYGQYTAIGNDPATVHPGARYGSVTWTDASGSFWLFGGQGKAAYGAIFYAYGSAGKLSDLWKYTPSTGLWTFVKGDITTNPSGNNTSQVSVYGTKGVAAATNKPGGRSGSSGWTDNSGNLWLFGGVTDVSDDGSSGNIHTSYMNDLWRYSPATNFWTWMSGDKIFFQPAVYGTQGIAATSNTPGAKRYATSWTDAAGDLYLFGGNKDSVNYPSYYYNDIWKYSVSASQWTWLGGDASYNMPGNYGTQGSPSTFNKPGARTGAQSWSDGTGNLWMFGGYGTAASGIHILNDMMKFSLSAAALPVQFTRFTARQQQGSVLLNWTTAQEQNSMNFIIERSSDGISFSAIGTVAAGGNTSSAASYSFTDAAPLQGNNFYRLQEVDRDGKAMFSGVQKVWIGDEAARFAIMGNPVQHNLQINLQLPAATVLQLQVRDANGKVLLNRQNPAAKGSSTISMPVATLPAGTYFLQVGSPVLYGTKAFVKQ